MAAQGEQDLLPEQTEGFKVGEKKTMDEYHKLGVLVFIMLAFFVLLSSTSVILQFLFGFVGFCFLVLRMVTI